jgi:hypothetical protein
MGAVVGWILEIQGKGPVLSGDCCTRSSRNKTISIVFTLFYQDSIWRPWL